MTKRIDADRSRKLSTMALVLGFAAGAVTSTLLPERTGAAQSRQSTEAVTIIHVSRFSSDVHAPVMALVAAQTVQKAGGKVTLFLDLDGVRLADSRAASDARMFPSDKSLRELYDEFVKAGGQVLVCAHCAAVAGIDPRALRPGAKLVGEVELGKTIQSAQQILDY